MPTISIITPVYAGGDAHLHEVRATLENQVLPADWSLQWVVQEDGLTGQPLESLPTASWISTGVGRHGGAARARNLALHRVTGELVRCLDADDLLPDEEALARDIHLLTAQPHLGWCVSPAIDLLPDGTMRPGPNDPPPGQLPPGVLADGLRADQLQVVGTSMTVYTELLHIVGGWPALPATEDVALMLACEAVAEGWMQEKPGEIYRKHQQQSTARPEHYALEERAARIEVLLTRADALRHTGWRWTPNLRSPDTPVS
jgi:glycosyltransferase involved in cell wall biosynthesis